MTLSGNTQVERQDISFVVEGVRCEVCKMLSLIRMLSRRNVSWGTKVGLVRRWAIGDTMKAYFVLHVLE